MQVEVNLTKTTVNRKSMAKLLKALVNTHDGISKRAGWYIQVVVSSVQVTCDPSDFPGTLDLNKSNRPAVNERSTSTMFSPRYDIILKMPQFPLIYIF